MKYPLKQGPNVYFNILFLLLFRGMKMKKVVSCFLVVAITLVLISWNQQVAIADHEDGHNGVSFFGIVPDFDPLVIGTVPLGKTFIMTDCINGSLSAMTWDFFENDDQVLKWNTTNDETFSGLHFKRGIIFGSGKEIRINNNSTLPEPITITGHLE